MIIEFFQSNNPKHLYFLKTLKDDQEIQHFLGNILESAYLNTNTLLFRDFLTQHYVGLVSFSDIQDSFIGPTISIYYFIHPSIRQQGYGTLIVQKAVNFLFDQTSCKHIVMNISKKNIPSQKVAKKCFFECAYEDDEDFIFLKSKERNLKV